MENIYTIKVRSNPDPRSLYPSERRYSASTVLGLAVFHLALAITVLLLASLSLTSTNLKRVEDDSDITSNSDNIELKVNRNATEDERNSDMAFLDEEAESIAFEELRYNQFVSLTLIPSIMALGAIAAGLTGLLAWKKWYIDYNIRWFFFMSAISVITALICITMSCLTVGAILEQRSITTQNMFIFTFNNHNIMVDRVEKDPNSLQSKILSKSESPKSPNLRLVLAINILIASFLELTWSILSTKVAYFGMKNNYPDDMILSRGKIEVSTVSKGNKFNKTVAPDILNHHPKKRKFVKYFPKNDNGLLPKQESNTEYRDRVNKFLSSNVENHQ